MVYESACSMRKYNEQRLLWCMIFFTLGILTGVSISARQQFAFINKPVVDVSIHGGMFAELPASPSRARTSVCPRAHQGLFNEIVLINRQIDAQSYEIIFDSVVYGLATQESAQCDRFVVARDDITLVSDLTGVQKRAIPPANRTDTTVVVVIKPWCGYSFGTRFVVDATQPLSADESVVPILLLVDTTKDPVVCYIPRDHVLFEQLLDVAQQRELFVKLAYMLVVDAKKSSGVVPYVWGGSSYIEPYTDVFAGSPYGWVRPKRAESSVYAGFDCSELVLRLAHMVGSDYSAKVSSLAPRTLPELAETEALRAGDLIWVPGHLMIVANVADNEIIEARGYDSGFGCVHAIRLPQLFKGIETFDQLRKDARSGSSFLMLHRNGEVFSTVSTMKFLRLFAEDNGVKENI